MPATLNPDKLRAAAVFDLKAEPEHVSPEGCFASGDDAQDAETVRQILADAEWNTWAWCIVEVTATVPGLCYVGRAFLGCCSYASADDFKQPGGYYEQMCEEALEDLARQVEAAARPFAELFDTDA